jgi:hypothetical protein
MSQHTVHWTDRRREPGCPPNPNFPEGVDVDVSSGAETFCDVALPYPAKRCGYYTVTCNLCRYSAILTTAGRPDDPRAIRLPCNLRTPTGRA